MTILGRGDLSPPRRYGRRGRRWLAVAAVLVVLGAIAWFAWREWHGGSSHAAGPPRPCVTPSVPPSPAAPAAVTVAVVNSTQHVGLAHQVAGQLRSRGFHVGHVGNTKPLLSGVATVTYAAGLQAQALSVAEQVTGATVSPGATSGVTLEIGADFRSLADPAAVASAHAHDAAAASPRPPVCPSS